MRSPERYFFSFIQNDIHHSVAFIIINFRLFFTYTADPKICIHLINSRNCSCQVYDCFSFSFNTIIIKTSWLVVSKLN